MQNAVVVIVVGFAAPAVDARPSVVRQLIVQFVVVAAAVVRIDAVQFAAVVAAALVAAVVAQLLLLWLLLWCVQERERERGPPVVGMLPL